VEAGELARCFGVGRYKELCHVDDQWKSPKSEQWNKSRSLSQEDVWWRISSFERGSLRRVSLVSSSMEHELPKF
jgi:hypothetical protein